MVWLLSLISTANAWTFKGGVECLQALHSEIKPVESMVAFDRSKMGVLPCSHDGQNGFVAITSKGPFFVAMGELEKSGDGTSGEKKVTVAFPNKEFSPIKFFYKQTKSGAGQISFAMPNEFDRPATAVAVPDQTAEPALNLATGMAFQAALPKVKTKSRTLAKALEVCAKSNADFKVPNDRGIESTFQVEIKAAQEKLKPGIFEKDRWFPGKGG